jgi:hypothetical protein
MKKIIVLSLTAALGLVLSPRVNAQTTFTLQIGLNGYAGFGIDDAGSFNSNAGWQSAVYGPVASGQSTDLLEFANDPVSGLGIGNIPAGATITNATLTLPLNNISQGNGGSLVAAEILGTWNDTLGNIPTAPSIAAGSTDITLLSALTASSGGTPNALNVTDIVQSWVNGAANNGIALYCTVNYDGVDFLTDGSGEPALSVTYTAAAVPEPSTLPMALAGGLGVMLLGWWRKARRLC